MDSTGSIVYKYESQNVHKLIFILLNGPVFRPKIRSELRDLTFVFFVVQSLWSNKGTYCAYKFYEIKE